MCGIRLVRIEGERVKIVSDRESGIEPVVVRLRKASPKVTGGILRVREAALTEGLIPAKVKVLGALAVAVAIRCEPCVEMCVERAIDAEVTFEEVVEFLNVAMAMQGCPGEAWALKALELFDRLAGLRATERKATLDIREGAKISDSSKET